MYQLSEVITEESGKFLTIKFSFDPTDSRLKAKTVQVTLSSDMNMDEVGMHLNKTASILLGYHEEAKKTVFTR